MFIEKLKPLSNRSRSLKVKLNGIFMPCYQEHQGHFYRYKIGSNLDEYFLLMNEDLKKIAKGAEGEEVIIKGFLEPGSKILNVESITLTRITEPFYISLRENYFELDNYEKLIQQRGKLEPALDYLTG